MTATIEMEIQKRDFSLNPRQLRSEGFIPATIYGKAMDSVSVQLETRSFSNTYRNNKESNFELTVDGQKYNTVVKNVQKRATTDQILSVEFHKQ